MVKIEREIPEKFKRDPRRCGGRGFWYFIPKEFKFQLWLRLSEKYLKIYQGPAAVWCGAVFSHYNAYPSLGLWPRVGLGYGNMNYSFTLQQLS